MCKWEVRVDIGIGWYGKEKNAQTHAQNKTTKKWNGKNNEHCFALNLLHTLCAEAKRDGRRRDAFILRLRIYSSNVYNILYIFDRVRNYMAMNVNACGYRIFGMANQEHTLYIINWTCICESTRLYKAKRTSEQIKTNDKNCAK